MSKQTAKEVVQTKLDELLALMLTPVAFEIKEEEEDAVVLRVV